VSEPITGITTPIRMEYRYTPGTATSRFLRAMKEGRFEGRRCPSCSKVYFPPRGGCSMCGVEFAETVPLENTGTVATYTVVNVNFANRTVDLPYIVAEVVFDGADVTTALLLKGVGPDEVRQGMRVEAKWIPEEEWDYSLTNISHVEPIDEPDAAFETYRDVI
jgi:uncharacterized OB-fold protein